MTVSTEHAENEFTGNGVLVNFNLTFYILNAQHIDVFVDEVPQTVDVDYTITANSDQENSPGGTLTFTVAPADQAIILAQRDTPTTQEFALAPEAKLVADALTAVFDKLALVDQERERDLSQRTFRWRGAWSSALAYIVGDAVEHEGSAYIAVADNTNSEPLSADWNLFASKGDDGASGGGTVTSVNNAYAAGAAAAVLEVSGGPITGAGTITHELKTQTANTIFGGPDTGAAAKPAFRALVADDIPNLNTSKLTAGTLPIARGGTNNGSLGVLATGIYKGDGSKLVQLTGAASQLFRVNAAGNDVEAFTLAAADIPNLDAAKITTGVFALARGGTNNGALAATDKALLAGDGTKIVDTVALGALQSVRRNAADNGWEAFTPSVGGGSPGGSDNEIQYNNAGVFGGTTGLTWNEGTNTLVVGSSSALLVDQTDIVVDNGTDTTTLNGAEIRIDDSGGSDEVVISAGGIVFDASAASIVFENDGIVRVGASGANPHTLIENEVVTITDGSLTITDLADSITITPTDITFAQTGVILTDQGEAADSINIPDLEGTMLVQVGGSASNNGILYQSAATLGQAGVIAGSSGGQPLLFGNPPAFGTLGLGGGGTNNNTLAATTNSFMVGNGSAIVDSPTCAALQSLRRNAAGNGWEAFTPQTGGVSGNAIAIKTSSESLNTNTTVQDDDALLFAVGANENWAFTIYVSATSTSATPDIKFTVAGPALSTILWSSINSVGTISDSQAGAAELSMDIAANSHRTIVIQGTIRNGANAGNLNFKWAQNSSNGTNTTVEAGSYILAFKV